MNDETQNTDLAPAVIEAGQVALMTDEQMEQLSLRVEQQQKIRQIVLKVTKPHHWRVMGTNAYLEQIGCKVIAGFLGMGIDIDEPVERQEKDEAGSYYSFTTKVTITWRGRSVDEYGMADSRDKFLAGDKPQTEVNKGNIKKKSITNAMNRGIKAYLGLDFTRAEVEAQVGSLGGGAAVDYKSKPKEELTADEVALKNEMKKKIWELCNKDEAKSKAYVKELTAFKDFKGHENFDKISAKQLKFSVTKINADHGAWEATQSG